MSEDSKKRVLSCIQPTGEIHLGNYFGALKNWVEMQSKYECIYGVVDLHAMTVTYNPGELHQATRQMFIDLLACGIDLSKCILFVQSLIPEHAELTWIFSCLTSYGELTRQTQFKDKSSKQNDSSDGFISVGLFSYPVLQAADILIYRANYVPVGQDQQQHLELSRNIAERFNSRFGDFFPLPETKFTATPKVMSTADPNSKMSKSLGDKHWIGLFEEEKVIRKKIARAVTDSGQTEDGKMSPGVQNLIEILKASENHETAQSFVRDFNRGELRYSDLKGETADALVEMTAPLKKRRKELSEDLEQIDKNIREMSEQARMIAKKTMKGVREMIGVGF